MNETTIQPCSMCVTDDAFEDVVIADVAKVSTAGDGRMWLEDKDGNVLAVYAPGCWKSVRKAVAE